VNGLNCAERLPPVASCRAHLELVKAKEGNVQAACELRGWYDQGLGKPEGVSVTTEDVDRPWQEMTPEERARVRAGVVRRIAEAEAQLAEGDPTECLVDDRRCPLPLKSRDSFVSLSGHPTPANGWNS